MASNRVAAARWPPLVDERSLEALLSLRFIAYTLRVELDYNSGVAPKWPPCRTAPEYFQYPAGRFILPLPLPLSSYYPPLLPLLPFPPLLHRSPTLSRVHSCLLVARTSLPAVNGFLFHPCPLASPIRSPSLARATVFRSIFLFLSLFFLPFLFLLFQKLPSHGSPPLVH